MRVLVIGASGAIGTRLVPQLAARGHEVTATSRSSGKAAQLRALGAEPAVLDVLDEAAVRAAVKTARPDAVVYQATALAGGGFTRKLDKGFAPTNRLRSEGTDNVLTAMRAAGVSRLVAQSFAPYRYARTGGPVKTEEDPLDLNPPAGARQTFAAMQHLDEVVTDADGIALRYGGFYGDADNVMVKAVRKRQSPIIGDGGGIMSWIHLDDAAAATVLALEQDGPAIYNITDDEPAPMREWVPVLAQVLGAGKPFRVPNWVGRLFAGEGLTMVTESRGAANTRAKKELGWTPRYPTWREGFRAAYGRHAGVREAPADPVG